MKLALLATLIFSFMPAFAQMGADCNMSSGGCGSSSSNSANLNGDSTEALMPGFGGLSNAATYNSASINGYSLSQASLGGGSSFMGSLSGMDGSRALAPGLAPATPPASDDSDYRQ